MGKEQVSVLGKERITKAATMQFQVLKERAGIASGYHRAVGSTGHRWGMQDALLTFGPWAEVSDVQQMLHKCLLK